MIYYKRTMSLPAVWCNQNQSALWAGQMGYSPRRDWMHRRRNDDVCSLAGNGVLVNGTFGGKSIGDYLLRRKWIDTYEGKICEFCLNFCLIQEFSGILIVTFLYPEEKIVFPPFRRILD